MRNLAELRRAAASLAPSETRGGAVLREAGGGGRDGIVELFVQEFTADGRHLRCRRLDGDGNPIGNPDDAFTVYAMSQPDLEHGEQGTMQLHECYPRLWPQRSWVLARYGRARIDGEVVTGWIAIPMFQPFCEFVQP
ncbi:MAG TPA: hypothetical protein PKC49_00335 [Phycisphaerae bacterium]|nr:hypothetical protein [Phycisphaerae bacterium]